MAATSLHAQQRHLVQQQQLAAAQALKQAHYEQLQAEQAKRVTKEKALATWAVRYAQGGDMRQFQLAGEQEREKVRQQVVAQLAQLLARPGVTLPEVVTHMQAEGYPLIQEPGRPIQLAHQATGARFELVEVQPNECPLLDQIRALNFTQDAEKKEVKPVEQTNPK